MDFTNKTLLSKIQRIVVALGIAGTVVGAGLYVGSLDPVTGKPESVQVNGEIIHFDYTDENVGETLVVYTDTNTRKVNVSNQVIHVAVSNQSAIKQDVLLKTTYDGPNFNVVGVSVLTEVEIEDNAGDVVTENVWLPVDTIEQKDNKETEYKQKIKIAEKSEFKRIEEKLFTWPMGSGDVTYFRIVFEGNTQDHRFVWQFYGSEGAYGHFDSWFGNDTPEVTYYAKVDTDNQVETVVVADPSIIKSGALGAPDEWVETDYEGVGRKNYAGPGFIYDKVRDAFIPPKTTDTAILDENTAQWIEPAKEAEKPKATTTKTKI